MSATRDPVLIEGRKLVSGYGGKPVLKELTFEARQGEITAFIGHNGSGKSTLLKTLFGLVQLQSGEMFFESCPISHARPRWWLRQRVVFVPQGQRIFPQLTVREHFQMVATLRHVRSELFDENASRRLFPELDERMSHPAYKLSGGERQMLAIACALIQSPRVLLLDEPTLGLAPGAIANAMARIQELNKTTKITILIVEQNIHEVLRIAHHVFVLKLGRVGFSGASSELQNDTSLRSTFL